MLKVTGQTTHSSKGDCRGKKDRAGPKEGKHDAELAGSQICPVSPEAEMPKPRSWSVGLVSLVPAMYRGRSQDLAILTHPVGSLLQLWMTQEDAVFGRMQDPSGLALRPLYQ